MRRCLGLIGLLFVLGCSGKVEIEETPVAPPTPEQEQKLTGGLVGGWVGQCLVNTSEGMSARISLQMDADHTFLETTRIYLNTNCTGQAADTTEAKGSFQISGVLTELAYELDMQYADQNEGDVYFLRLRILQKSVQQISAKYRIFQYIEEGEIKSLPANYLEGIPEFLLTRDAAML